MLQRFFRILCSWLVVILCVTAHLPAQETDTAASDDVLVYIDLKQKRLTLYRGSEEVLRCVIAGGTSETPSPLGVFTVHKKFTTQLSGFGTRFIGIRVPWGQYGIHGTNKPSSLGQNASHGCIRLSVRDAEKLYPLVPIGTKVVIDGGAYAGLGDHLPTLLPGLRSSHVYEVQKRLINQGFLQGNPDGVYGANTSRAVLQARAHFHLSREDKVDAALYQALGIALFE